MRGVLCYLTVLGLAGAGLSACAANSGTSGVGTSSTSAKASTSTTSAPATVPACASGDLGVTLKHPGAAGGSWSVYISVENISGSACSVSGWPSVTGMLSNGQEVAAKHTDVSLSTAPQSSTPATVTLQPGKDAYAQLEGSDANQCNIAFTRFSIIPPVSGNAPAWDVPAFNNFVNTNPAACYGAEVSYLLPSSTFPR